MTNGNDSAFQFSSIETEHTKEDGSKIWDMKYGLTKREQFAAMAMQGILSNPMVNELVKERGFNGVADLAADHADALIESLNKKESD